MSSYSDPDCFGQIQEHGRMRDEAVVDLFTREKGSSRSPSSPGMIEVGGLKEYAVSTGDVVYLAHSPSGWGVNDPTCGVVAFTFTRDQAAVLGSMLLAASRRV